MNFLAHLVLGDHDHESLAGSILGDFVRGGVEGRFPVRLEKSIRLHRTIDGFTDDNEFWKKSRGRLSAERRRYAGVVVDVFYDYLLAVNWKELSGIELKQEEFIAQSYRALTRHRSRADDPGPEVLGWLVEEDWLSRYSSREGVARTFRGLSQRTARSGVMLGSEEELFEDLEGYEADFRQFWPQLLEFVEEQKALS